MFEGLLQYIKFLPGVAVNWFIAVFSYDIAACC